MASTSDVHAHRTSFSDKEIEYLLDNSNSDIDTSDMLSENENCYEEKSDSSAEEDSSAIRDNATRRQQCSDCLNYLTTHTDFQHFPYTLQNSGSQAHTVQLSSETD
jgi:hypothetical protein